jgi:Domain of unknown function (DUF4169)
MSAEIVNLRLTRKRRERLAREEAAAQNRLSFGATKASREHRRLGAEKAARDLEAHRLDLPGRHADVAGAQDGKAGPPEDGR